MNHRVIDFLAMAELATIKNYVRPKIEDSQKLAIKNGRHVTVEHTQQTTSFVANDCEIDEGDVWLITGANMGGKVFFFFPSVPPFLKML